MNDITYALRTLIKSPLQTIVVLVSLALGIGANTAVFSLMDQMLLRNLPVRDPESLVFLEGHGRRSGRVSVNDAGEQPAVFSYPMMRDLQGSQTALEAIAAYRAIGANLAYEGQTVGGSAEIVSGNYFSVLGVQPAIGRAIEPRDDERREQVAVISYGYWQDRLGGDPGVLNRKLIVNGQPFTIVGVAPRRFTGTTIGNEPEVWLPISLQPQISPTWDGTTNRQDWWVYLLGRLPAGVAKERAATELTATYRGLLREEVETFREADSDFRAAYVNGTIQLTEGGRGRSSLQRETRLPLILMMVTTLLVLLIACANVANLLLVRAANRNRELAIRVALGAGRWPIFRQMLTESIVLSLGGAALGLLVGRTTLDLLITLATQSDGPVYFLDASLDLRVLAFTAALAVGTGVLFGLYPAWVATRIGVAGTLKEQAGQVTAHGAARVRKALVTAQVAVSVLLLVSAGLFAKSLANVATADLGFQPDGLITFTVSPELNGYKETEIRTLYQRAEARLLQIPGVRSLAMSAVPFLENSNWGTNITVEGYTARSAGEMNVRYANIGPGLFATMGVPLVAGREFNEQDGPDAQGVVVVNEQFVRRYFPDGNAMGKRIARGGGSNVVPNLEIVGIVRDMKYSDVKTEIPALFYAPLAQQEQISTVSFYLRTSVEPEGLLAAVRQGMAEIDPNLPLDPLRTMQQTVAQNTSNDRLILTLSGSFAALATLLATFGLYGVMAYSVACRTREIGIRMTLGAGLRRIQSMVLQDAAMVVGIGALAGLSIAFWLTRYVESELFGVKSNDPLVFLASAAAIAAAGLLAGWIPARRAAKVDPMTALRYE